MAGSTGNRQKLPSSCQRNTIYSRKTILHLRYNKSFLFASQQICYKKQTYTPISIKVTSEKNDA